MLESCFQWQELLRVPAVVILLVKLSSFYLFKGNSSSTSKSSRGFMKGYKSYTKITVVLSLNRLSFMRLSEHKFYLNVTLRVWQSAYFFFLEKFFSFLGYRAGALDRD